MDHNRKDILLADCEPEELEELICGLNKALGINLELHTKKCNGSHTRLYNIYRYLVYILFPFKFFLRRKQYRYIICWQQFYALFFSFFCRLFRTRKCNFVVVCNFTYKEKSICRKSYKRFFSRCATCQYIDVIHVLSDSYAAKCAKELDTEISKFHVVPFGYPDVYHNRVQSDCEYNDYALAIGRSNRDYDFLVEAWKLMPKNRTLLIIGDTYKPKGSLPENIIHRTDISSSEQLTYVSHCNAMIIPIADGSICSGDTVLVEAMACEKAVFLTEPSTLSEMYIDNGINGIVIKKDPKLFAETVEGVISVPSRIKDLGKNARLKYEKNYSRQIMGLKLGEAIKLQLSQCKDIM